MSHLTENDIVARANAAGDQASGFGKMLIVWVSTITGMTVTEWAAVFACIYTLLQIYIVVRDKIVAPRRAKKRKGGEIGPDEEEEIT